MNYPRWGLIQVEHSFHHLPFLIACGIGTAALELADEGFPFSLSGQSGEPGHRFVPIEVCGSVNNHHKKISEDVYFHLEDANFPDAIANLLPIVFRRVPFDVLASGLFVGAKRKCLYKALRWALILFLYIAFHIIGELEFAGMGIRCLAC